MTMPLFQNPQLPGGSFFWPGSSKGVLLIHGFTATTAEIKLLAGALREMGFTVAAPLLPGHGTTPQDMNKTKYGQWLACVEDSYRKLTAQCTQVVAGGESMGAVLSLYLAQKHPEIKALLLYSTAIKVQSLRYAKYLKWITPLMDKSNNDPQDTRWQGYTVYPMRAAHEFAKLQKQVIRNLHSIEQPALILQGIYDKTIDEDCGQLIYNAIHSEIKDLHIMQQSGHVMLLGDEFELITKITVQFLKRVNIL
jgi:carboxylesterase